MTFPVVTARLAAVLALVSVLVAVTTTTPGWTLAAADSVVLLVAVADVVLAPGPASITVDRELPGSLVLGAEGEVRWRVRNPAGRRTTVRIADELAPSLQPGARRFTVVLPAGASREATTTIVPTRRGRFTPQELTVRTIGPLGLAGRQRRRQLTGQLRVLPPFRSRKEAELRIDRGRILEIGLRSAQGRGGGTEFEQLREYGVDDEFRRIDWAATARAAKPIVRTYRAERNQTVLVLLDCGRVMAGRVDGVPRIEHAMDAAMMLTAVATRLGDRAGLVAFDRDVRVVVPPSHSSGQLARVTEAMYALEPNLVESDYRGAFAETLARWRRRALLVLLTELTEEGVGETLVPAMPLLSARHVVISGSVTDPDVVRWAASVPTEVDTTYRKAAAVSTLERRARTAALLGRVGARVVDAPPGALSGRLADAYLHIKAVGGL